MLTVYSTSGATATETQSQPSTQFTTLSTSITSVAMSLADPPLELGLAALILISVAIIGINLIRHSPRGGTIVCRRCGVENSSGAKYCVSCGEPVKRV
jgi:hypothetical protein